VQRLHGGDLEIPEYLLRRTKSKPSPRFHGAQGRARSSCSRCVHRFRGAPGEIAAFIDTSADARRRSLTDAVVCLIRSQRYNAEAAVKRQRDALVAVFEQMEDPYLRSRKDDVQQSPHASCAFC